MQKNHCAFCILSAALIWDMLHTDQIFFYAAATKDNGNKMMATYHTGAYNLHQRKAWSCCGAEQEKSDGCSPVESSEGCELHGTLL